MIANRAPDTLGHSSIQPWSAGSLFPAVIAKIERYVPDNVPGHSKNRREPTLEDRLDFAHYELILDGGSLTYSTYEDAESVAKFLLSNNEARADWRARAHGRWA